MTKSKQTTGWQADGSLIIDDRERQKAVERCREARRQVVLSKFDVKKASQAPKAPASA